MARRGVSPSKRAEAGVNVPASGTALLLRACSAADARPFSDARAHGDVRVAEQMLTGVGTAMRLVAATAPEECDDDTPVRSTRAVLV